MIMRAAVLVIEFLRIVLEVALMRVVVLRVLALVVRLRGGIADVFSISAVAVVILVTAGIVDEGADDRTHEDGGGGVGRIISQRNRGGHRAAEHSYAGC